MLNITKRQFLIGNAVIGGTLLTCGGSIILEDYNMKRAPEKQGKILVDLHTHPSNKNPLELILNTLSNSITGLTACRANNNILTYNEVLNLHGTNGAKVQEIDKGLFAKITYKGNTGYFLNSQEVLSDHHILTFGIRERLPDYEDARKTIEEIQKRKRLAILDHPFVVTTSKPIIRYRFVNEKEKKKVRELYQIADEVEVFNAQCINLIPVIAWMHRANESAKELAKSYDFKGTASSDTHTRLEQVGVCGIYVSDDKLCIDALQERIVKKDFERYEQYVSKISFLKGHFLG